MDISCNKLNFFLFITLTSLHRQHANKSPVRGQSRPGWTIKKSKIQMSLITVTYVFGNSIKENKFKKSKIHELLLHL